MIKPLSTSLETAQVAEDYPYGGMRTKMFFFVEYKKKKGWRAVTQSLNPKTGRMNKPHASTYSDLPRYVNEIKPGFFEFTDTPHLWDKGEKLQVFVDFHWKDITEEDRKYIKTYYDCAKKVGGYYENVNVNFPA